MKKFKIIFLLLISLTLAGCVKSDMEVFRFVNHEIEIEVDERATLELIYGEFSEDSEVKYTFSKTGIVSLEGNVVTGLEVGEVSITATIDGVKKTTVIVRVLNESISSMKIISEKNKITVGESVELSIEVYPTDLSNNVTWSLEDSNESKITAAKIEYEKDNEGRITKVLLTGLVAAENKAEYEDGGATVVVIATSVSDPTMSVKKLFKVYELAKNFTLTAESSTLVLGQTLQLQTTIDPEFALDSVTYTSSNESILLVDENGLLSTPKDSSEVGKVTITATTMYDVTTTIEIEVVIPEVIETPAE